MSSALGVGPDAVSILARAEARALPAVTSSLNTTSRFQSSPAPRRGRYAIKPPNVPEVAMFQSSPAPRRGRYQ